VYDLLCVVYGIWFEMCHVVYDCVMCMVYGAYRIALNS